MKQKLLTTRWSGFLVLVAVTVSAARPVRADAPLQVQMDVDARDLPRSLLHARLIIPARAGKLGLWYPKWIPGIHGPRGPVENIGGLRVETAAGEPLVWQRDGEALFRVDCHVPAGCESVVVRLDYICNQPSVNSNSIDSFGNALSGIINWNTCLVYPDGPTSNEIEVRLRLRLPPGWRFGTSLAVASEDAEDWIVFEPARLHDLIDAPLVCGEHFRTIPLGGEAQPVYLHLTSESKSAIQLDESLVEKHRRLVKEALALFGTAHYRQYHFLVTCSETLGRRGLEHLSSSLNGVGERDLIDEKKRKLGPVSLLPHEYVHSWCGKYRRPAGMATPNFHQPKQTHLLWIYEGLTQYLGEVLTVRSGMLSKDEYLEQLAVKVDRLMRQKGRDWRSLEDTAVATWQLRRRSPSWGNLRRGQDYYDEGLLFWLEADAIIRTESDGRRSLDDFCKRFFGRHETGVKVVPYELSEVIEHLAAVADYDWQGLVERRIALPQDELSLEVIGLCGYRLRYETEPSDYVAGLQTERKHVWAFDSLGLVVNDEGRIRTVVPDMAGDRAGLAPGMQIMGVDGRKFSSQRLCDSIADSVTSRHIELLILEGDRYRTVVVDYANGPKNLRLVRDEGAPDVLGEILEPQVTAAG